MKITEQQLAGTMAKLPEGIKEEYLQEIVEPFPPSTPYAMVEAPMIVIIRREQGKTAAEDVRNEIISQLKAKKPASPGQNPGNTRAITRSYFEHLLIEQRLLGTSIPDTAVSYFGRTYSTPVMTAALSHLGKFNADLPSGMVQYAEAAKKNNTLHWVGMSENEEFEQIMAAGADTVRIIKPYRDEDMIYSRIECARKTGAVAVGMDIDHIFTRSGDYDVVMGEEVEAKSDEQFRSYIEASGLPFVIKGVLSVKDAEHALDLGASAIVVSHHGGRIDYAVPPLYVLPEIAASVKGKLTIFVDCGVQSGMDVYKAMALGADGVSVGTHLLPYLRQGNDACAKRIGEMTRELRGVMAFTGVKDTKSFDAGVLHLKNW